MESEFIDNAAAPETDPIASDIPSDCPESEVAPDCGSPEESARFSRIGQYEGAALTYPDLLCSNLAVLNAGQMRIAARLETIIELNFATGDASPERLRNTIPLITTYLNVTRQIDRYARATHSLETGKSKNGLPADSGREATTGRSEDSAS